jgi:hypothetical protein
MSCVSHGGILKDLHRREWLAGVLGSAVAVNLPATEPEKNDDEGDVCSRCHGIGRVPRSDAKPWVWTEGQVQPKWAETVGEEWCPLCHSDANPADLIEEWKQRFVAARAKHETWEERTGWKLQCVVTRHAVIHTQLSSKQAREVGAALEKLTLHLKKITGSLAMTPTRPDEFELVLLLEKPSWEAFRKVMEKLHTPPELGEAWYSAQRLSSYDHFVTPHLYETKETLRARPPSCGATFIVARRQLSLATAWQAPLWLSEGFAAYGDYVVHGMNRWYSVYSGEQIPVGDWMVQARRLTESDKALPWSETLQAELRDWRDEHHFQTMAMVAFLLESKPTKFLNYLKRLKDKEVARDALEAAYGTSIADLEKRCADWIIARR